MFSDFRSLLRDLPSFDEAAWPAEPPMDFDGILKELHQERDQVAEVIATLERLARGRGKRRGRPPKWLAEPRDQRKRRRGRPHKRRTADEEG